MVLQAGRVVCEDGRYLGGRAVARLTPHRDERSDALPHVDAHVDAGEGSRGLR